MAETVVINIEANTQGLQSTIDLLVKLGQVEKKVADDFRKTNEANVKSLQQGVTQATGQFQKLDTAISNIGTDNKLAESLDATAPIVKTTNSIKSFKQELKDATAEALSLAAQFGELDPRAVAAAKKVSELRQTVEDTNRTIKALDPGEKFRTIQNLGGAIAGAFQVATGALQAFGVESETATKLAQQFQGALNIVGGLQQLADLKDQLGAVRAALGLTTVAKEADAVASTVATNANRAFAASLSATGIGAAIVVLGALAYAISQIGVASKQSKEDTDNLTNSTKKLADARKALQESKNAELDADLKLKVIRKEITQAEADRIQLSRKSSEVYVENQKTLSKANQDLAKTTKEIAAIESELAIQRKNVDDAPVLQRFIKINEDRLAVLKKTSDQQTAIVKATNDKLISDDNRYRTEFAVSKEGEANDAKKAEEEKRKAAAEANQNRLKDVKKTAEEIAKEEKDVRDRLFKESLAQDLANLDNYLTDSLQLITNNYNERDKIAKESLNKELMANLENLQKGLITFEQYEAEKSRISQSQPDLTFERQKAIADQELAGLELRKMNLEDYGQSTVDVENAIAKKKEEINVLVTNNQLAEDAKRLKSAEDTAKAKLEAEKKVADLTNELNKKIGEEAEALLFQGLNDAFETQLQNINDLKDEQLQAIDDENKKIEEAYANRLIGKRQFELEQERLTKERIKAEEQAEKKLNSIRKKQDIANKAKALFEIYLNTRRSVTAIQADPTIPTVAKPPLISASIIFGGIQAASVLAQPLPKYKKGTLAVMGKSEDISYEGGRGTMRVVGSGSEDTELALLQPGEAVIPTDTNRKYHPAIKAIYENKIKPQDINQFVTMRLRGDISRDTKAEGPVMAKMDIADLYALGRIMKKNDGVTVKNIKELASIFADSYNPRR